MIKVGSHWKNFSRLLLVILFKNSKRTEKNGDERTDRDAIDVSEISKLVKNCHLDIIFNQIARKYKIVNIVKTGTKFN